MRSGAHDVRETHGDKNDYDETRNAKQLESSVRGVTQT